MDFFNFFKSKKTNIQTQTSVNNVENLNQNNIETDSLSDSDMSYFSDRDDISIEDEGGIIALQTAAFYTPQAVVVNNPHRNENLGISEYFSRMSSRIYDIGRDATLFLGSMIFYPQHARIVPMANPIVDNNLDAELHVPIRVLLPDVAEMYAGCDHHIL